MQRITTLKWVTLFSAISVVLIIDSVTTATAAMITYDVSGGVTGTVMLDFSTPDLTDPSAGNYSLTADSVTYTHLNAFKSSIHNYSLGVVDNIDLRSGVDSNNFLRLRFIGPAGNPLGFTPYTYFNAELYKNGRPFASYGSSTFTPVPAPSSLISLSTGLIGLAGYRWSQRRRERLQIGQATS